MFYNLRYDQMFSGESVGTSEKSVMFADNSTDSMGW
jgi:hypothetical protein